MKKQIPAEDGAPDGAWKFFAGGFYKDIAPAGAGSAIPRGGTASAGEGEGGGDFNSDGEAA